MMTQTNEVAPLVIELLIVNVIRVGVVVKRHPTRIDGAKTKTQQKRTVFKGGEVNFEVVCVLAVLKTQLT